MPGTTSLGIRYPFQGETVDQASWQNMAVDIDGLLSQLDVLRSTTTAPATASVFRASNSATLATTVTGNLTFDTENWDTAGYANLGVNNDRFTVQPGVFYVCVAYNINTITTTTGIQTLFLVGGAIWGGYTVGNIGGTTTNTNVSTSGLIVAQAVNTTVQVQVRWNGTGGPAVFDLARFIIIKVRDLVNV